MHHLIMFIAKSCCYLLPSTKLKGILTQKGKNGQLCSGALEPNIYLPFFLALSFSSFPARNTNNGTLGFRKNKIRFGDRGKTDKIKTFLENGINDSDKRHAWTSGQIGITGQHFPPTTFVID